MKSRWIATLFVLCLPATLWLSACRSDAGEAVADTDEVSYNFHIRPLLSDKCFKCHGPDTAKLEAGLRLDIAAAAYAPLKESQGKFAIVPGKPEQSELIRRIKSTDSVEMMPPPDAHLGMLSKEEIALFEKWIAQGAKYEPHWAFTTPKKPAVPDVDNDWARTDIDKFVLAMQQRKGLEPNEEETPARLLKRLSIDLTGLPPTLAQMDAFEKDHSDAAYEKMVDALLATPQYGEKMALHWLDVGRYADSYGYQDDNIRTQWPWRDWVIHAFNNNMPYDQFLTWQIAGDMLPAANKEQILATAFFRNHKYTEEGGVIDEEYRVEYLIDKVKTYTKGVLGLTVECAQCHDHKYDPISQKDYYSMFAFFNNTYEVGYEGDVSISKPAKHPLMTISQDDVKGLLRFINKKDTNMLTVSVMGERDTTRKTYVLNRGVYNMPTSTEVKPEALPAVMTYSEQQYPRNRLGLAKWTTDKRNPLTARVFVNQIWQELFGRGIVKTSGDFGMQGELPSHPQLLDWLATDFMDNGWNMKRLVKQIVMSATYRQSARVSKEHLEKDPENVYLARAPRQRLKAELVKDLLMASSGLLNPEIGGPSVKPYQPKGIWETASSGRGELATYKQDSGSALYRRGMYTFIKLTVPPPSMAIFDASNRDQCEVKRLKTSTPLQALVMMNDPTSLEASRVLTQQLLAQPADDESRLRQAFRRIICRQPTGKELDILKSYLEQQRTAFSNGQLNADKTLAHGEYPLPTQLNKKELAAWMKLCSTIYNMEEAITK